MRPAHAARREQQGLDALRFIREHIKQHGYPPSRNELRAHLGLGSTSTAQAVIDSMVADGLISVDRGVMRGIRVNAVARTEPV